MSDANEAAVKLARMKVIKDVVDYAGIILFVALVFAMVNYKDIIKLIKEEPVVVDCRPSK